MSRRVFYSFHYENDVRRVQQIRNMGIFEGNSPASPNRWEDIKQSGDNAIKEWIDDNMAGRSCVIVLIGEETANRKWVKYEIENAWNSGKALLGIYIHNLKCPRNGTCRKGRNPFTDFRINSTNRSLSDYVVCHDPINHMAYKDIQDNISQWIEDAIQARQNI